MLIMCIKFQIVDLIAVISYDLVGQVINSLVLLTVMIME